MTGMLAFHEKPEFLLGRNGEQLVVAWLTQRGWFVIPSYDYSGTERDKAPKLQGLGEGFPVPDLDVCRAGDRRWIEVKTKSAPDFTRKTGRFEHGIEHYDDYLRVAFETGTEAWLAIFELKTRELLAQSFAKLGEPRRSTMYGKRMAYWPRDAFMHLHTFPELTGF
jgi:hypothetical protein